VVLFDFDRPELGSLYDCLAQKPGPLFFGFSTTQNTFMLLSSALSEVTTIDDLQAMIVKEFDFRERRMWFE
jgi:hypothetical protein